ncbi:Protein ACCELERATED CELL DEATH 6 [Camellia lanceoleosa]|uniref:Protein ACCELERATED CELL DEATH 6 n=1 Tax=Camellia lanceoleosa TaxID=1840588 RepID=A0ACC0IPF6_9ERIC|nr:Protein ACCELERATED CELL DEATH 6 [Camellia lanceoleosa]
MDRKLFKAAMDGHVQILKQCNQLECQSTPTGNTVLHIASLNGRSQCVEHVLSTCTPLLKTVNKKGETPLHIAARKGYADIVGALIECARTQGKDMESGFGVVEEMVRMVNEEKDTALHMAVRNGWVKVGELLVREDPEFEYYGEFPGSWWAHGENRLACSGDSQRQRNDIKILEKKRFLTDIADEDGWTPLHYAAHFNHVKMVRLLLKQEKSAAYTPNKEGKTALHIAASRGHTESMQELISECPDCCELVDGRGQNALHVAVENNEGGAVGLMLKNPLFGSLINEKDVDGNTPLHLLATWGCYIRSLIIEPRVDKSAYNAENLTALDIASCTHQFSTLKVCQMQI